MILVTYVLIFVWCWWELLVNLLVWYHWANWNQMFIEWSSKICFFCWSEVPKRNKRPFLYNYILIIQWNLSKLNLLGTNFCVRNRQVFVCFIHVKLTNISSYKTFIIVWFIQDFSLDRFHLIYLLKGIFVLFTDNIWTLFTV
jgi:hypothetical protein